MNFNLNLDLNLLPIV